MAETNALKMLILGLTGECNFMCSYCYADRHPQGRMSLDTATRAIAMAAGGGKPFVLQFSGGEPLLAFDVLREIADNVRLNGVPAIMQVQTNASLIDRRIAEYLRDARIGVGISLDGRPDQNDALRRLPSGAGTSRLILRGAGALAAAGAEIGITCVVTADNVRQLPGIVEMAYYLGNVRKIGFDLLRAQGRGAGLSPADARNLEAALRQVLATARRLEGQTGRKLLFSHAARVESLAGKNVDGFAHCHAMNGEAAFVDASGEIYACASLAGFPEFRLGNVKDGIDPCKQRAVGAMVRKSMRFCPACPSFALCGGGCFARWYGGGSEGRPHLPECALKSVFIREYLERKERAV
ncbi:MAG TPA: radical SAM protein [Negativicutes bacterium]|nr:radical SAM protein [Negativicutes bacterium]